MPHPPFGRQFVHSVAIAGALRLILRIHGSPLCSEFTKNNGKLSLRSSAVWMRMAVITLWKSRLYRQEHARVCASGTSAMHEQGSRTQGCPTASLRQQWKGRDSDQNATAESMPATLKRESAKRGRGWRRYSDLDIPTTTSLSGRSPAGQRRTSRRCSPPITDDGHSSEP